MDCLVPCMYVDGHEIQQYELRNRQTNARIRTQRNPVQKGKLFSDISWIYIYIYSNSYEHIIEHFIHFSGKDSQ